MTTLGKISLVSCLLALSACDKDNGTIFTARQIITMDSSQASAKAVYVRSGIIKQLGDAKELQASYPNAILDSSLESKVLVPGFIDPHIHMIMGALIYSRPFVPPWDMETPKGVVKGLSDKTALITRLKEIESSMDNDDPLIAYGYHNLIHGDLTKADLDQVSVNRPVFIWHYSGHDFYLNSAALEWAGIDKSWAERFHGIAFDQNGELSGRVFEDAAPELFKELAFELLTPSNIEEGFSGFENMLARAGVTSVAELGYGLFGKRLEDIYYWLEYTRDDPYHLYLVPEHRAFYKTYGDKSANKILKLAGEKFDAGEPKVLPQVKFFTDAAFYSQTMMLEQPGYVSGQSAGTQGIWATQPENLLPQLIPYWQAGLDIRIHSNGDAAQTVTLSAMRELRNDSSTTTQRFVIEHAGLLKPEHIEEIAKLGGGVSAASHYVYYMGDDYRAVIGDRVKFMTPLASAVEAEIPTTLHSDAPLAPPYPLQAAAVHMTRSTRNGNTSTAEEALSPYAALASVTREAAWALGLEDSIGTISIGKRANFTVLDKNPIDTPATEWPNIKVYGVVLDGVNRPLE